MPRRSYAVWLVLSLAGCGTPPRVSQLPVAHESHSGTVGPVHDVRPVGFTELPPTVLDPEITAERPLSESVLVRRVLDRNPTLDEMRAAVAAAEARVPQVTSLDDPMAAVWAAPTSVWSNRVDPAARLEVSQKLFWPGKLEARGAAAAAEAGAASGDLAAARLELVEAARTALADYFLADRALEVNRETRTLLTELRKNAETRLATGVGLQQDILQADVELAVLDERAVGLRRARQVARARLNTLMHRPADSPLGPPPTTLRRAAEEKEPAALRAEAVAARPDVLALQERLRAEQAAVAAAQLEYNPDVEVMAAYDRFWQGMDSPLQWQVGARVNLPIRLPRRDGAVAEAQARVARRRAELARLQDQIGFQVQEVLEQVREARQVVELYEQKVLPAVRANIKAARSEYTTGRVPFLVLSEAQRALTARQDRYLEAQADLYRRQAALDRVVGRPVPPSD